MSDNSTAIITNQDFAQEYRQLIPLNEVECDKNLISDSEKQFEASKEKQLSKTNTALFKFKKQLSELQKSTLNKRFECSWDPIQRAYRAPLAKKIEIEPYLQHEEIIFESLEIHDLYFDLSANERKALRTQIVIGKIGEDLTNETLELKDLCKEHNAKWKTEIKIKDILQVKEEDLESLLKTNDPEELEHLKILFCLAQIAKEKDEKLKRLGDSVIKLKSDVPEDISKFLEKLEKNEIGDAELFVEHFKDKYVFDPTEGKNGAYYLWTGTHWKLDEHKERYNDFDEIANAYLSASKGKNIEEKIKESLEKRSSQLRTDRRRRSVLETISSKISFRSSWDYIPNQLPCKNGVIDLVTGQLLEVKQDNYIRKLCPVEFNVKAECPKFLEFLNDISLKNNEWIEFLQRSIGYTILGNPKEEVIFYWYGKGRNGKGTLAKVLQDILGPLIRTFPSEMLLMQRNPPSSSAPSPELANLEGVRIALFSEINKDRKIDSAKVKNLSGGDLISCRRLFSNIDLQIKPTHTMILQTNCKPEAPADDNALWARNILIPFNASFVRDPKNQNERPLKENLKDELLEEREGILQWLLDGCRKYQENGLQIPQFIRDETESYRKQNDGIARFLEERCSFYAEISTPKKELRDEIQKYCEENKLTRPTKTEIKAYLKDKFGEGRTGKGEVWVGVQIIDEVE